MKASELRDMTIAELNDKLADLKKELFNLRFQLAVNQLENPMRIKAVKKDIARVNTVITAKSLEEEDFQQNPENDFLIKEQNKEFVNIAKQKLSKFEFLVFSLYTMQYSYKEIAQMTKKDEKSINNAVQRIHKKLRK